MNKITLIGTIHKEGGACNSDELIKIIEGISPEIIFCEASPEIFPTLLKATKDFNPPEIKALRRIIKNDSINIIPIDISGDPFDKRLEAMLELFRKSISDYFYAAEIQVNKAHQLGFPYLNSEDSDQIHRDKNTMEKIFVSRRNDVQLSKLHKDWLQWNDDREHHWISKIQDCFKENNVNKAVFLVGSAHRVRLMEKIKNLQNSNERSPAWDFYTLNNYPWSQRLAKTS